ncbi:unknown [Clostridium sp. CAG:411]|jgi:hypothetical protein|nr:unknown [Clostridium sp. CAG:411]
MKQTIQIADKPTLDEVKELLENSGYGLEALANKSISSGLNVNGYRDCTVGKLNSTTRTLEVTGKGKIIPLDQYMTNGGTSYYGQTTKMAKLVVDSVTIFDGGENNTQLPVIEFEESVSMTIYYYNSGNNGSLIYLLLLEGDE